MFKQLSKSDIILFGELHNNPISHWLQLEVTKDLAKKRELALGAEMLEADNQTQLNDYLNGKIDAIELDSTARLWPNYKTDYKPLVDFAKDNLVLLNLDFPAKKANRLSEEQTEHNEALAEKYNKKGVFPLLVVLNEKGASLDQYSGYSMDGKIQDHLNFLKKHKE